MKRLALVAAVLAIAACSKGENAGMDSSKPAMAPAADTGMKMDTAMKMTDTKKDSTAMKSTKSTKAPAAKKKGA